MTVLARGHSAKTARFPLPLLETLLWTREAAELCGLYGQLVQQVRTGQCWAREEVLVGVRVTRSWGPLHKLTFSYLL